MPAAPLPRRRELIQMNSVEGAHRVGLRAAISVSVPLALTIAAGHPEWAPYACFGAFASLYGRASDHLLRAQMQLSSALTMVLAVVTGVLVTCAPGPTAWLQVAVAAVIAATGDAFARAHSFHPPGSLFMVFAFGSVSSMPHTLSDVPIALAVAGAAAAFSVLVGVAGVVRDPRGVRGAWREAQLLRLVRRPSRRPWWIAVSVVLAGSIAVLSGIGHPYWATVAAIAPMSAPHVTQQIARGIHRVIGTMGGLVTSWMLLSLHLSRPLAVAVIAALQFGAEMLVGRNYGAAMLFVTPLALMMGQLVAPQPIGLLLFDRGAETVIGAVVAIALVMLGYHLRERRKDKVLDALNELGRAQREKGITPKA